MLEDDNIKVANHWSIRGRSEDLVLSYEGKYTPTKSYKQKKLINDKQLFYASPAFANRSTIQINWRNITCVVVWANNHCYDHK